MSSRNPDPHTDLPPTYENCHLDEIYPIEVERATGIIAIHRHCVPPCPRKAAAIQWLAAREAENFDSADLR